MFHPGLGSEDHGPRCTHTGGSIHPSVNLTFPAFSPSLPQRQPAFDTFDGSLFAVFPSLNEKQALQEVPTGLDSLSHGNALAAPAQGHAAGSRGDCGCAP